MGQVTVTFEYEIGERVKVGTKNGVVREQHNSEENGHEFAVETLSQHGNLGRCIHPGALLEPWPEEAGSETPE